MIICGGGHISLALAPIGSLLGFDVIVIDDREEFANAERFPEATALAMPFLDALNKLGSRGESDYHVVLTWGHKLDYECVEHILRRGEFAYLGMIGSRAKVSLLRQRLQSAGFPDAVISRLHAPIGLSIGAETPAEIAVAIAAELVSERAKRGGASVKLPNLPGVLVTVVGKRGSAPRGVGAKMLVTKDGEIYGTVGGGSLEALARSAALDMAAAGFSEMRRTYDLSSEAFDPGMVCGGIVELEFVRITHT